MILKSEKTTFHVDSRTGEIQHEKYILNPKYFFKGYYKDRFNVIEANIRYEIE